MKSLFILLFLIGLTLTLGYRSRGNDLFQVISAHPHDIKEIEPFIDTVYQNGRLWIVQLNDDAPDAILKHLKPLSGREKSYLYEGGTQKAIFSEKGQDKISIDIDQWLADVNLKLIEKDVVFLASYKTRYAGTSENQKSVEEVGTRFRNLGFSIQKVCYRLDTCNLVAEKKGSSKPDEILMVMGHIDSVGKDFAGADDNGTGVAVMLEMARHLTQYPNRKTIRFFISNGEELGLIGSTYYADKLSNDDEISKIKVAINMDMVGYNSNGIVELETEPSFESLAKEMADLANRYTELKTKITLGAWGSDHVPFLRKNVPTVLTIEDWDTKTPCYHLACDKPETVNYNYAAEIAKLNLATILTKDLE